MVTVTPLRRIEFSSSDPFEAGEFLFRVRGGRLLLDGVRDKAWRLSLTQVDTGQFSSSEMRLPADLTFQMHGRDEVVINAIRGGAIGIHHGKARRRYRVGDVYVASYPRADSTACSPTRPPRPPRWSSDRPPGCSPPPR